MTRLAPSSRRPHLESFAASVSVGGHEFTFHLHTRPLSLGTDVAAQYYWMDSSGFRITRRRRSAEPANLRNCIGHWWAVVQAAGLGRDPVQISHLILATSFGLISGGKAVQQVFRDAHLAAGATAPEGQSLPEEVQHRIRAVVLSRDRTRVGEELDETLGRAETPSTDARALRQTFDGLLQVGIELVRDHGNDGLEEFLARFDAWSEKHRKKGGRAWLRRFLNLFGYACKASFYLCYANAWISLIPWLRRHRGLDDVSERLLRFWHMQNQSVEQPDGRASPDVFWGQVLSLHPLSGFFMKDPGLCAAAGRFFSSGRYGEAAAGGLAEYWEVVGAVLTAARLYRQAADEQANARGVRRRGGAAVEGVACAAGGESAPQLLEDFAASQKVVCPNCHSKSLRLVSFSPAGDDGLVRVEYACPPCARTVRTAFDGDTLTRYMTSAD
jgi:hypothetical protein